MWSDVLERARKDATRSCERGKGPAVHAQPLPLAELGRLPGDIFPGLPVDQ